MRRRLRSGDKGNKDVDCYVSPYTDALHCSCLQGGQTVQCRSHGHTTVQLRLTCSLKRQVAAVRSRKTAFSGPWSKCIVTYRHVSCSISPLAVRLTTLLASRLSADGDCIRWSLEQSDKLKQSGIRRATQLAIDFRVLFQGRDLGNLISSAKVALCQ